MTDTTIDPQLNAENTMRADGLDALRGFAILAMALSGLQPYGILPSWMYHAQVPPPNHVFNPGLPGLTWVDLVFPFFLFSMGAAIPLALQGRINRGAKVHDLLLYIFKRGLLLCFFALFVQHVAPWTMNKAPTTMTWVIALVGFLILFPAYARLPRKWSPVRCWITRIIGWGGAAAMLTLLKYPDAEHQGFWVGRSNIIIVVLTNAAVFGSLLWLVSRKNIALRFLFMFILIGLRLAHSSPGWVQDLWNWSPAPWIYKLYYQQYLLIVLPGTIIGDIVLRHLKGENENGNQGSCWSILRLGGIATLMLGLVSLLCVGMQSRWLIGTNITAIAACAMGALLFSRPGDGNESFIRQLYLWGVCWLIIGLVFEPYEGGIKKDSPTLSYYFVTTGLAIFTMIFFTVLIDIIGWRRWFGLLTGNGQNPMVAYIGIRNLVPPLFALTGADILLAKISAGPWTVFLLKGCVRTLVLAIIVSVLTRCKIVWRT